MAKKNAMLILVGLLLLVVILFLASSCRMKCKGVKDGYFYTAYKGPMGCGHCGSREGYFYTGYDGPMGCGHCGAEKKTIM
jgi:hypothetical protein